MAATRVTGHPGSTGVVSSLYKASAETQKVQTLLSQLASIPEGESLSQEDVALIQQANSLLGIAGDHITAGNLQGSTYVGRRMHTTTRVLEAQSPQVRRSKRPVLVPLDANLMPPPKRSASESPNRCVAYVHRQHMHIHAVQLIGMT